MLKRRIEIKKVGQFCVFYLTYGPFFFFISYLLRREISLTTFKKSIPTQYDYKNRLVKMVKQEDDETLTVTFAYDPFGRRIEKKIEEIEDGETEEIKIYTYIYDNEDIILEYLLQG